MLKTEEALLGLVADFVRQQLQHNFQVFAVLRLVFVERYYVVKVEQDEDTNDVPQHTILSCMITD